MRAIYITDNELRHACAEIKKMVQEMHTNCSNVWQNSLTINLLINLFLHFHFNKTNFFFFCKQNKNIFLKNVALKVYKFLKNPLWKTKLFAKNTNWKIKISSFARKWNFFKNVFLRVCKSGKNSQKIYFEKQNFLQKKKLIEKW